MSVLSNKAQEFTEIIVDKTGIRSFFSIVLGSNERFPKKPAPDAILFIIKEMESTIEKTMIIGDTKNDILAGKNAKISTCAVSYGFRKKKDLISYNPDYMIDSISELRTILQ